MVVSYLDVAEVMLRALYNLQLLLNHLTRKRKRGTSLIHHYLEVLDFYDVGLLPSFGILMRILFWILADGLGRRVLPCSDSLQRRLSQ
jgi:hypothetical protein